ncbi:MULTISPECIES: coenzyme-B sulfoethylthiotransferase subunit gamma [Methanobacterium]|uniref:Methyl-coenzyme M reductase subunit gamma n=1 Tax=Methanobacterium formicicum TaxID=2162 RepID=A0A090I2T7_METFO|nr:MULTISPECIES: coenzyme-B sulfoethylthiotransferase subunit gamma [Methanobacterium]AIS31753.1 methyl-coenzyme M reductase gamma subunit McrG [Methanobacterium formicicum]AXV40524.1 MAG: coenzyme-B sulfoethylthiotransferase subunit gamma [Methanobacterium sp. BAmetb5]KUK74997.1 MAG: Methyl coenzyme M reductase I subunit gamma [Methanobacterium sp. 42_16]MDD4811014.1 coenzyme-B sulfoethylthiotransferase subunit gamma [Methanobacterium formicicum]MDG3548201.1 coenzyme-B sulfoethylthiotransfera
MAQYYPGTSKVAENRRRFCDPNVELEKLREISDEDIVKILGHRAPGEEYPSVHPPLEEMDEPDDAIREMVEPLDGAKAGDRVRYIQFADSMYFAPAHPFLRSRAYLCRYRGADAGTLSGRQIIETRERDLEKVSKELLETEFFDPARTGFRGKTVHGHSLRLDEDGMMFDMLRRQVFNKSTGKVEGVKNQIGDELDEPVILGEPLDEATLKEKTTIYRKDGEAYRDDADAVEILHRIHVSRSKGGFCPE